MRIIRELFGQKVEIPLTGAEVAEAHAEHVTNFMFDKLVQDFGYEESVAKELAKDAYEEYCEGNGLTEYECIEEVVSKYEKEN